MFVLKFWQCKVVVWCERETADAVLNTERKTTSTVFYAFYGPTGVTLLHTIQLN